MTQHIITHQYHPYNSHQSFIPCISFLGFLGNICTVLALIRPDVPLPRDTFCTRSGTSGLISHLNWHKSVQHSLGDIQGLFSVSHLHCLQLQWTTCNTLSGARFPVIQVTVSLWLLGSLPFCSVGTGQGYATSVLECRCTAEFSPNPERKKIKEKNNSPACSLSNPEVID